MTKPPQKPPVGKRETDDSAAAKADPPSSHRREFLTGKAALEHVRSQIEIPEIRVAPSSGHTIRLTARAMACDFSVILNPGPASLVALASECLDRVAELEQVMTIYRPDGELAMLNESAAECEVVVSDDLFEVLSLAIQLHAATGGAFDPTTGPLIRLWRESRQQQTIPTTEQIEERLQWTGLHHVHLDEQARTVVFDRPGVELNLGAIGKGFALDQAAKLLRQAGQEDWLLHGGRSSVLASGNHAAIQGWPVGIGNPLFTDQRLATIVLRNLALGTSGSNVQFYRHQGKRYGHILDPQTGFPVEGRLSVSVTAATATEADALSTAFFGMGVEKVRNCCDNLSRVGALLMPLPSTGREVSLVRAGSVNEDDLYLQA